MLRIIQLAYERDLSLLEALEIFSKLPAWKQRALRDSAGVLHLAETPRYADRVLDVAPKHK